MKNKNIKQEIAWVLIVALFITGFFLIQGSITGYTVAQSTILEDIQINAETQISPTLEVTIPIKQLTDTTLDKTHSYIKIKPITEQYNYINIVFKVENSWIINNNLEKSEIALYIYNKDWEQLPTEINKEKGIYTHYKARTKDLGLFAIAKSTKKLHIEKPVKIEPIKTKEQILSPLIILVIIILTIILIVELFSLIKHKIKFILILLAFAIMALGLIIQQPITKEILTFGLLPISIIAFILSFILTILLNKLRKYRLYSYIRNIIISILISIIFIISITVNYNKEALIYAVLPIITITIIASSLSTLLLHINLKLKKNKIYTNIRNIILSLIIILIVIKLLSKTIYYLKSCALFMTYLSIKLFIKEIKIKKKTKRKYKRKKKSK